MSAPGEKMKFDTVEKLFQERGGTQTNVVYIGRNHDDDMQLFGSERTLNLEVGYVPESGDLFAEEPVSRRTVLLGSVGPNYNIAEVFDWLHSEDGQLCGQQLSWLIARMATLSHEPAVCDSLEEFGDWRHIGLGGAMTRMGRRHHADAYGDIQSDTSGGVSVYLVHQTGDVYTRDHMTDGAALLGQIDPSRREEFIGWAGPSTDEQPLSLLIARIEVFNNLGLDVDEAATPACWDDEPHWWASDRHMPTGYAHGTDGPVVNEVCYRCGLTRRTSMVGTVNNPEGQTVELPPAVLMGPRIVVTGGPGAKMAPNSRETFLRLVTALFPDRVVVTLSDEEVSDLNCPNCDLWVGDLRNREIAHVSTTHRQGDGWTCEAEAPSGVAL